MDVVRFAIMKPVTVLVGVVFVLLFGFIALKEIPYQLSPNVSQPEITVETVWPGATPYEIERDIIEEQERYLKGVPKLDEMESTSSNGRGSITLRFELGTDVDDALLRVSNAINEVPSYPENVDRPVISASGSETSPVVWTILKTLPDNERDIAEYRTFFENEVRQNLERVDGVSDLFVFGGTETEMHVIVDAEKLSAQGLTISDVVQRLRGENANVSAGNLDLARREYRIRSVAEFRDAEDIENVVLKSDGQRIVYLRDVGRAEQGFEDPNAAIINNFKPGIACGIRPEPDANVLNLTDEVEGVVKRLNEGILAEQGIYLDWAYDQRPYIRGAIDLLKQNIAIGGCMAIIVLLIFLRSIPSTLVVATAIPISIVGTFLMMRLVGSTLNVVSLAGIAFAVGMLVDNAIVVLENIDRHRRMGQRPRVAAYTGAREVWGAVLASTLTTVAVFLPVFFLEDEAGQLFGDIAIAVASAVSISLFVSVLVIPMLSRQIYRIPFFQKLDRSPDKRGAPEKIGTGLREGLMGIVGLALKNPVTRLVTVLVLAGAAVFLVRFLLPKMEYLPQGNRNLIINILVPPPGLSYQERLEIGEYIYSQMKPHFSSAKLEEEGIEREPDWSPPLDEDGRALPTVKNMFYVGSSRFMLFGVIVAEEQRAGEFIPVCRRVISGIPGFFGISTQAGVFQQGLGRGRNVDLDFKGKDLDRLASAAGATFGMIMGGGIPDAQVRPVPSIEQLFPEARFHPLPERLRAVGMNARQFGEALDVLMDGRQIGDFKREGEKKIDLVLKSDEGQAQGPEQLYHALIATPLGGVVPVSSLSRLERASGLTEIRHLERDRTMTLRITPPDNLTLQEAMETLEGEILPQLGGMGLDRGIDISLSGTADKLSEIRKALQWDFALAVLITYLLMSALFGNFIYPLVILVTVPMAAAGGFLGLRVVNLFVSQSFDVLTMLGFIILIGVVVNNAILIVHQSLNNIRENGMGHRQAVVEATRSRIRPIYMSATTSIFGMLPLVVAPGPGSELYRGLGAVVLGGLALSTVFTVFLIPALLMFVIRWETLGATADDLLPTPPVDGDESD